MNRITANYLRRTSLTQAGIKYRCICYSSQLLARQRRKPRKNREPDDHLEAFEQRRIKSKEEQEKVVEKMDFERKKKKEREKTQKDDDRKIADFLTYASTFILALESYRLVSNSLSLQKIDDFEKLDRIPVHRFFEDYLMRGKIISIRQAFATEETNVEFIIETTNHTQFVVTSAAHAFLSKLAEIESALSIKPNERFSAKLPLEIVNENFGSSNQWRDSVYQSMMWSLLTIVIIGGVFFRSGGFKGLKQTHRQMMTQLRQQTQHVEGRLKSSTNVTRPIGNTSVRLADVAGMKGEKEEIQEFINFLKKPAIYHKLGAKMPKGVLLSGPPGTGKTLLGKAVATECGVPFYYKTGAEFSKTYVGEGSKEIRQLFSTARKNTPCIIYIDEIDSMGKRRGQMMGGGSERDVTLNQLLVEMDGLTTNDDIVIMAATNQPETLDEALTRPGRLSRKIYCGLPDKDGRTEIFKIYLRKIRTELPPEHYAEHLAELTPTMSGAQIANVCNEAALRAARDSSDLIKMEHFEDAVERINSGIQKATGNKVEEKKVLATIEAGKCLVSWILKTQDTILKSSIVPRTHSNLGYTQFKQKERFLQSEEYLKDRIAVLMAGKVAQKVLLGRIHAQVQADEDSKKASNIANDMVHIYGMGSLTGQRNFGRTKAGQKPIYSNATRQLIDHDRARILHESSQIAEGVILENKCKLLEIISHLCDKEVITEEELSKILGEKEVEDFALS